LGSLVDLAGTIVAGDIAARQRRFDEAIRLLAQAVTMQDAQRYNEPPTWYYPVRHSLGAAMVAAGRFADAEAVYREDLERNPENGWALFGLMRALEGQQRSDEASAVEARFRRAWARADVTLTGSVF
jgi:tetratricopeptide (TPR) repeat protein